MTYDRTYHDKAQQARDLGIEARKAGQPSAPALHKEVMDLCDGEDTHGRQAIMLAFARGWTTANLAEEVTYDSTV